METKRVNGRVHRPPEVVDYAIQYSIQRLPREHKLWRVVTVQLHTPEMVCVRDKVSTRRVVNWVHSQRHLTTPNDK